MPEARTRHGNPGIDSPTVIALSMLAYTLSVLLHEYLGHAMVCVLLGGHLTELGAFYVNYDDAGMPDISIRLIALAGPTVSLIAGVVGLLIMTRMPRGRSHLRYWAWLFGTVNLMTASGYLLFSGVTGLGDLGTSRDGVRYRARPEVPWRSASTVLGAAAYAFVISLSLRRMDALIGGEGTARVARAQKLALTSYLTGSATAVLIGLLNPHGMVILLVSAAASTVGGTSGLVWMMQMLDRRKVDRPTPAIGTQLVLDHRRSWRHNALWCHIRANSAPIIAAPAGPLDEWVR